MTDLDPASLDAIARRVLEVLEAEHAFSDGLIDAREVARRFGLSRSTVYEHAAELGAIRLGDGPKARLRFDPQTVEERFAASARRDDTGKRASTRHNRRRRARARPAEQVPLLEIRQRSAR